MLLIKSTRKYVNGRVEADYQAIALNKTEYGQVGSNTLRIPMGRKIYNVCFACSKLRWLMHNLEMYFDHIEKEPYITISIQHKVANL